MSMFAETRPTYKYDPAGQTMLPAESSPDRSSVRPGIILGSGVSPAARLACLVPDLRRASEERAQRPRALSLCVQAGSLVRECYDANQFDDATYAIVMEAGQALDDLSLCGRHYAARRAALDAIATIDLYRREVEPC